MLEGLDLAEYFITSKAEKEKIEDAKGTKIIVKKTTGKKCPRCWKILETNIFGINKNLYNEISKLSPFGSGNELPTFLIKDVKIIKSKLVGYNHINSIIKPSIGPSINTVCFDCINSKVGDYLLSYKKKISIIANIVENSYNNKTSIQLIIKDLFLPVNSA